MARLASLLKGGYYPLSDANTLAVAGLIAPAETSGALYRDNPFWTRRPYTLLDPFCGEGRAVRALADAWNAVAYGVELHPERAEAAQALLGENVLCGPAEGLESSGFDLVYSNPPYDNRVEVELTLVAAGHVAPGGLLLTVLPEPATVKVLEALTGAERRGFSLRFAAFAPDPEWKQVVAVLRRERYSYYAEAWTRAPFGAWAHSSMTRPPRRAASPRSDGAKKAPHAMGAGSKSVDGSED